MTERVQCASTSSRVDTTSRHSWAVTGSTRAPRLGSSRIMPSASSRSSASRTGVRDTPVSAAMLPSASSSLSA
ncbi:MAG: hypothetical protein U0R72_11410 [Nakamurella multipartita]